MLIILFVSQYKTKPEGNDKKKKVKTIGINNISLAWLGSADVGLIFCWKNIDMPIKIGRTK